MITVIRSAVFDGWQKALLDFKGTARIVSWVEAAERGNFGGCEPVGEEV